MEEISGDGRLSVADFARAFGVGVQEIDAACVALIEETDFRYRRITGAERDGLILGILKRIDADTQVIGAPERHWQWQAGWAESLKEFTASGCDLEKLVPKFVRPGQPVRLDRDYVMPRNPRFELDYITVLRHWLYRTYFTGFSHVYEFGCGTGFNLALMARMYPDKTYTGLDFAQPAVELVDAIGRAHGWKMRGRLFDMLQPDAGLVLEPDSVVHTFGALEQLASRHEMFLQYLLRQAPGVCVHIEPTVELYDADDLIDHLAIRFHRKRGYSEGFLPRLRELEKEGKIEVLKAKRLFFGSLYLEGYVLIVWRCLR